MDDHLGATTCGGIFESQSSVLDLLELPSRRVISCISSLVLHESHCSVNTFRIPYDDDVFASSGTGQDSVLPSSQFQGEWEMPAKESRHLRPIGMSAIRTITSPYSMGLTVARNMSLACLNLAHKHILLLTEAEEKAIDTGKEPEYIPFPWDDMPEAIRSGGIHSGMDVTVLSMRGMLDWTAECCFSRGTSLKMHTDLRKTAKDMLIEYSAWQRVPRVMKTSLFSEITLFASEWIVSCILDTTRLILSKKDHMMKRILIKIGMHGARCSSLWLAVSFGNGMGSSSPKLQPLCMLACAQMCSFLVNSFYISLTGRIERALIDKDGGKKDGDDDDDDAGSIGNGQDSPQVATSFPVGLSTGPDSPDVIGTMQGGGIESPVPTVSFRATDDSNVEPSTVRHTISSKGPRLPPRRKISVKKDK
jgi:hypothetical protein